MNSGCAVVDVPLFNALCHSGDFCMADSSQITCPLPASVSGEAAGCIYKPHDENLQSSYPDIQRESAKRQQFLTEWGAAGAWDCSRNHWVVANGGEGGNFKAVRPWSGAWGGRTGIVTVGDSVSENVFTGLGLIASDYKMSKWRHDRNDAVLPDHPWLSHVCCGECSCGGNWDAAANNVVSAVDRAFAAGAGEAEEVVLAFRVSLHNSLNVERMVESTQVWIDLLEPLSKEKKISLLHIDMHGHGAKKLLKYLPNQGIELLRQYAADTLAGLKIPPTMELFTFDPLSLVQGAECKAKQQEGDEPACEGAECMAVEEAKRDCSEACGGAYESPDGTHLSLTTQVTVGRLIIEAFGI